MGKLNLLQSLLGELEQSYRCAQVVQLGHLVYISEAVGCQPKGQNDLKEQLGLAYGAIRQTLATHGANFENVIQETLYLRDTDAADELIAHRPNFARDQTAATAVEVSPLLSQDLCLEVEVVAQVPFRKD